MGSRQCMGAEVLLHFEEYEALRLADYDLCTHAMAAERMGVSRPTFTRIYEEARRKVSTAFVESRPLLIEGGQVEFGESWFHCRECGNTFAPVGGAAWDKDICPLCQGPEPEPLTSDNINPKRK